MKVEEDVELVEGIDHLRLEVFTMEPLELIAVIFELVSNDKVLGEIGPDRFIPCVVPPEYVNSTVRGGKSTDSDDWPPSA